MKMEWKVSVFPEKKWKQRETNVSFRCITPLRKTHVLLTSVVFVSPPPPRLDPTRSIGMPLTTNRVYDNFLACLSMDRAMEY